MGDDETLPSGPDGIPSITKKSFWRLGGVVSWFCQMPRLLTDDCKMSFSVLDCRLYTSRACFPQMFVFGMRNVFSFTPRFWCWDFLFFFAIWEQWRGRNVHEFFASFPMGGLCLSYQVDTI